jgi:DNA-binding beta-propeller fold protein YncE
MWPVPSQEVLITQAGERIVTSLDPQSDLRQSSRFMPPSRGAAFVAFDVSHRVFSVAEGPVGFPPAVITHYNSVSYESFGEAVAPNGAVRGLGFFGDQLIVAVENGSHLDLHLVPHPALEGDRNTPPVADFSVTPPTGGTTADLFVFDAAASQDAEHPETLLYRWDLDSDGSWDAPYSSDPTTTYRYATAGTHRATLSVKDHLGLVSLRTREISLQFAPDLGEPGVSNIPFEFPFTAHSAVFDDARGRVYVTDWEHRAVHFVDAATGLITRTFRFDSQPDQLALSPDRKRLLMTLIASSSVNPYPDTRKGNIGSFDLDSGALDRFCRLSNNVYQIAPIDDPRALVTTAGPAPLHLQLIDTRDCSIVSSVPARGTQLAVHPGLERVYVASHYLAQRGLDRFELSDDGSLVLTASDQSVEVPRLWVSPSGDYLIVGNGSTFASRDAAATDLEPLESVSFEDRSILGIGFDTTRFVAAIVDGPLPQGGLRMRYINLLSRERLGPTTAFSGPAIGVGIVADRVGVVVVQDFPPQTSRLRYFPHPAVDAASNPPPRPSLVIAPGSSGTTLDRFSFDASASTDAGSPGALRFRWDLDGDGTWEDPASLSPTSEWSFETAGRHTVRLRVIDSYGTAAETSAEVDIQFVPDEGAPAEPQRPWELPFLPTDLAVDALGHRVYVSDAPARRVVVFDLATGLPDRTYQFVSTPGRLSASADGRYVYVALGAPNASRSAPWKQHQGFIARFDLQARTKDSHVSIAEEPYDLVATRAGLVAVSPAGLGEDSLRVFDGTSGQLVGAVQGNRYRTTLLLDESETRLYSIDRYQTLRARLFQDGAVTQLWTLQREFGSEHETFVAPDRLLSMSGAVLQVTDDAATDLTPIGAVAECQNALWDRQASEFWTFVDGDDAHRYRSDPLELLSTVTRPNDFPRLVAKAGKLVLTVDYSSPPIRFRTFTFNHPPLANAGPDQHLECSTSNSATASLDGRASSDTDSTPESNDDIKGFIWTESQQIVAGTSTADVTLAVGAHQLDLTVTDDSGATNTDSTRITVNDSVAPQGSIVSPTPNTCFGPGQLPVMLHDNVQDTCDPSFTRRYEPPGDPGYSTHGDQRVTLITTDASTNASSTNVAFTIDRVPPQVAIHPPSGGWRAAVSIPFRLTFTSTDDDGAAGAPEHELVLIDGCLIYDGDTFGDKDGVLSDEEVWIDDAALCRAAATCGTRSWRDAIIAVRATDCGANEATGTTVLKGTASAPPGGCQ